MLAPLVELLPEPGFELVPCGELEPLPERLSGAELAVNLHGRGPQSHRLLLAAEPRRRMWFEHPEVPESQGAPRWRPGEHEPARWCRLVEESGVPADPSRLELRRPRHAGGGDTTLIHPGAASAARRWPAERFAAVARDEREAGRRVVVTGGRGEEDLAARVGDLAGLPRSCVLAGRTDLSALARRVAAAGRVVCGDTGIAHLAVAMGTPSLALFGPTDPAEWGPPPAGEAHRVIWKGHTGDPHAHEPDPGLLAIGVDEVLDGLAGLPHGRLAAA